MYITTYWLTLIQTVWLVGCFGWSVIARISPQQYNRGLRGTIIKQTQAWFGFDPESVSPVVLCHLSREHILSAEIQP